MTSFRVLLWDPRPSLAHRSLLCWLLLHSGSHHRLSHRWHYWWRVHSGTLLPWGHRHAWSLPDGHLQQCYRQYGSVRLWGMYTRYVNISWRKSSEPLPDPMLMFCSIHMRNLTEMALDVDGSVQERRNSSALAMELRLSCTNPSNWCSVTNIMLVMVSLYVPGQYCDSSGLSVPRGDCDAGYYCPGGQNVSSPSAYTCTPGHYCPSGSPAQLTCAAGTYQDEFTQV